MDISSQSPHFPPISLKGISFSRNAPSSHMQRDGYGGKPWVDKSATAPEQFLNAQPAWAATWGEGDTRGMTVKSVKMFNPGACNAGKDV